LSKESNSWEMLAVAYDRLARCYELKKDLRKALDCTRYFVMYKDSLLNENNSRTVSDIETKYQTEKKDLEISKQSLEIQNSQLELGKKKTQLYISLASVFLVLLLSYLFYTRYRLKQKQLLDEELLRQQDLRSKAIIEAEEKERIRIAKDLHDGVGQQLSAVKMNLSAFESALKTDNEATRAEKLKLLMELVDESVKEVRAVSHNMMPNALLRSGLVSAVREFVNKISTSGLLKIDLEITGLSGRLEGTTETVLYRVLQECVSNIIKHAKATSVSIQLIKHDSYLNLMLEDNGKGFDTSRINDFAGIGLKNIISRVQFLNGTIEFDSQLGKGTTVIIDIPLI
jgi:two-component system NarL family sensor kinase